MAKKVSKEISLDSLIDIKPITDNQKNVFDNLKHARYLTTDEDTTDDSALVRTTIDLDYPD